LLLELDFPDPPLEEVRVDDRLLDDLLEDFEPEDFDFEDDRGGGASTGCRQEYMYSPSTYWAPSLCHALRFERLT